MKIIAVIQARLSSTRLPGKVLMGVGETTMLNRVQTQILKSKLINNIVIASDDKELKCEVIDGVSFYYNPSINTADVLKRTYESVKGHSPDIVARVTSDCPLVIPELIDLMIATAIKFDVPYMGIRDLEGIFGEVFSFKMLESANRIAVTDYEREHVTPYIKSMVENVEGKRMYLNDYKFSVDTQTDLDNVCGLLKYKKDGQ